MSTLPVFSKTQAKRRAVTGGKTTNLHVCISEGSPGYVAINYIFRYKISSLTGGYAYFFPRLAAKPSFAHYTLHNYLLITLMDT